MSIIEEFESREDFITFLKKMETKECKLNGIVIKFTASWCAPCQKIKEFVHNEFNNLPNTIQAANLDVDDNFDLFANMKKLKQLNGIPAILFYKKGNVSFISDESVLGADEKSIKDFFVNVRKHA